MFGVLAVFMMVVGVVSITATVPTINGVGGWDSPDLSYVLEIFWSLTICGVGLVCTGMMIAAAQGWLPVTPGVSLLAGFAFSVGFLLWLHQQTKFPVD